VAEKPSTATHTRDLVADLTIIKNSQLWPVVKPHLSPVYLANIGLADPPVEQLETDRSKRK
jgi:hypothetical protein